MYYTYILQSLKEYKYYIGSTQNVEKRLARHNKGGSTWTRPYRPWKLVYYEVFNTRKDAVSREKYLKSLKDKDSIRKLTSGSGNRIPV